MGQSKLPDGHPPVFLNVGGDIGDKSRTPHCFLRIEVPQVSSCFASLNFLYDVIDLRPLQGLVPIHTLDKLLNLFEAFASFGKACNKVTHWRHA